MEKKALVVFMALLFVLPMAFAQTELKAKPISRIHLVGNGLAINSEDAMDFLHAKAVVGAVKLRDANVTNTDDNFSVKRLGVLLLDKEAYHLKNVAVTVDEVSADVFERGGEEAVGSLYVTRYEKPGQDVWAGELSLNDKLYNVYFVGLKRNFKPVEAAEKVANYCEENPEAEKCQKISEQCEENPRGCKAKIMKECKDNPENEDCTQIKKNYCLENASDVRCRQYLVETCEENPEADYCKIRQHRDQNIVSIIPGKVRALTAEAGELPGRITGIIKPVVNRWKVKAANPAQVGAETGE